MALSECVMYLDENFAKLPKDKEIEGIQKAIEDAVSSLLTSIAAIDCRFESKLMLSGSFYEGTKIRQADEFDFMVCLSRLSDICDITYLDRKKRHVLMHVFSPDEADFWSEFCEKVNTEAFSLTCSNQGTFYCLNGSTLKQKFYSLLREAFKSITWPSKLKFLTSTGLAFDRMGLIGATQAAASEKLDFLWDGYLKVSVDLSLAIECKEWPSLSGIFDSCIDEKHPAFSVKNEIKSSGFHVVPKLGTIWRISWSKAEATLMKFIFSQNEEAAVSYRVAKLINETHFVAIEVREEADRDIHEHITLCESFSLKHLLIFLMIKNISYFTRSCGEILVELLGLLLEGLNNGNCPLVFLDDSSSLKTGPLLQCQAAALRKCLNILLSMQEIEVCQVPRTCEDFYKDKIPVILPSPPRKLRSYKITKL